MSNGWIKLHRQITENPLYFTEKFTKIQAWIDILLACNHSAQLVFIRGNELHINRGQSAHSIITWGDRWKWNERTVKRFLNYLQKNKMIQYKTSYLTTIITVVKYEQYQGGTEQSTEQSTDRVQTNNNDKKEKEIKTIVGYLNSVIGSSYRDTKVDTVKHINARFNEGYSLEDFRAVIDKKAKDWIGDPKMSRYLRPITLFGSKFENYLQESTTDVYSPYDSTIPQL